MFGINRNDRSKITEIRSLGYLTGDAPDSPWATALWNRLRELGWAEGENLAIERRYGPTQAELFARAREIVALPVDVLVTVGTPVTLAAREATETIPIVFAPARDPVGVGLVVSLARPGGNVTGVSQGASTSLSGKRLELLKAVVPGLVNVARIADAINPAVNALTLAEYQQAAGVVGTQIQELVVGSADDLASAFATAASWPAHGLIVGQSALLGTERARIAEFAAAMHLPAMYQAAEFVYAGGLMSYGTSSTSLHRHAATFVDKILRGAKPADLPVEQLTMVDFAVNLKAVQDLGRTIPPEVAAQVTEWVLAP